ncbi:MAG TPA: arginase family protein [Polyangiaceae bacterium]
MARRLRKSHDRSGDGAKARDAASRHAHEARLGPVSAHARSSPTRSRPENFRPSRNRARAAGVASLLRLPIHDDPEEIPSVDVLLTGVPFDGGSSFRPGARFGPRAVREASALSNSFSAALGVDVAEEIAAADGGDLELGISSVEAAVEAVADHARRVASLGVIPAFVGGDRTLTLGALRGLRRAKHKALGILAVGAHPGASSADGEEIRASNFLRHAVSEGLVRTDCAVQVGLRGPYPNADEFALAAAKGMEVIGVDEVRWDLHAVVSQVRRLVQRGALYVSVDLSALDPAFAPGVSFPAPGGMSTWELQQVLRALVGSEILGFDVVGLAPPYDHAGTSALAAVGALHELLAALADTRRSARPAPSTHRSGRAGRRSP